MKPIIDTTELRLFEGDCREVIASLPDGSVDSCVTDPPYELGFMGKGWDASGIAYDLGLWRDVLRVMKPGGHVLAFGGSRTWHRLASAIEDAGFEIRDSIAWLYGSGFPKSMDVSKAVETSERGDFVRAKLMHFARARGIDGHWLEQQGIASAASFTDWTVGGHVPSDRNWEVIKKALSVTAEEEAAFEREITAEGVSRAGDGTVYGLGLSGRRLGGAVTEQGQRWQGWGTALKPAFEPIVVGRKPLDGTVAHNVLTHGVGGLNIDGCRVGDEVRHASFTSLAPASGNRLGAAGTQEARRGTQGDPKEYVGRFPPNVVLDDSQAVVLDDQSGELTSGRMPEGTLKRGKPAGILGEFKPQPSTSQTYGDTGGASRFFPTFHWQAKAPTSERPNVDGVQHPTVKPLDLMRWLVRLVTPRGGLVLEPFAGSGTTVEAALMESCNVIAAELTPEYIPLIRSRVEKPITQGLDIFGGVA